MEEQFILRVPPSVAERIERLLNENAAASEDKSLDLSFSGKNIFVTFISFGSFQCYFQEIISLVFCFSLISFIVW